MEELSGLFTTSGKPILTTEYVEELRKEEDSKKLSRCFIAHKGAQENDLHSNVDILVTGGNRGGGKANSYDTPVIVPSGIKLMGNLVVGDKICTPYNGIQTVTDIFEHGEQRVYNFFFDDGTKVTCMDNHRFLARMGTSGEFKVMTAREIIKNYRLNIAYPQSLRKSHSEFIEIPLCGEVEKNENISLLNLPLHPFVLGYISGMGTWEFGYSGAMFELDNVVIKNKFKSLGYKVMPTKRGEKLWRLCSIPDENRRRITNRRTKQEAWIPDEYMNASIACRWEYLRGIMLKAGYSKKSRPCLSIPNKKLVEQVADLARSLGIWVRVTKDESAVGEIGNYVATFVCPNDKDIFYKECYRKNAHINGEKPKSPNTPNILTKKIIQINKQDNKKECRCITVSGRDHLYMTDAYTVNHNTALMLMEDIYDIDNKHFNSVLFRKNKDDFDNIENESKRWFSYLGRYNKSRDDMTWNFRTGAKMSFDHFDMSLKDFEDKYRGQQFGYVGIDEFPQMPFEFLKILMGSNRNTVGVRSRIVGTCNPDPLSWLRVFIDWWIGKEDTIYSDGKKHPERKGLPIPERDGVVRYCFMGQASSADGIIWGDTPMDVYRQCRQDIDAAWDPDLEKYGYNKITFAVKSVTFIKANIKENTALLRNDPGYIASILNKSPEERAKEWEGNWDVVATGDEMIQPWHIERIFGNAQMLDDNVRRASCDVAGNGGDNCVTWLWIGWHVADVFVCRRDLFTTIEMIRAKLHEWGVLEQNFTYDLNGMGQVLKGGFPKAVPFNNQEAVKPRDKGLYDNLKSQCAYLFAERTQQAGWSIEPSLLQRRYITNGETRLLRDILMTERKCVKQDMSKQDRGWCLIHKEQMKHKSIVGHSPDFFEALMMREIFSVKHTQVTMPKFLQGHIRSRRLFTR